MCKIDHSDWWFSHHNLIKMWLWQYFLLVLQRGHRHRLHRRYDRSGLYPGGRALGCGPGGTLPSGHARTLRHSSCHSFPQKGNSEEEFLIIVPKVARRVTRGPSHAVAGFRRVWHYWHARVLPILRLRRPGRTRISWSSFTAVSPRLSES